MQTYEEIYNRMKQKYVEQSGNEFDDASDVAIRMKVLAGEVYNAYVNMEWIKNQMFVDTASGKYLDYLASQRGIERKKAVAAKGELTFYVSEPKTYNIAIPKGTVVATSDDEPIRFVTTEDETIVAGGTLVSVYAEAESAGKNGNVIIGRVVVPVNVPSEVSSVVNREPFAGGVDKESDNELRNRIKDTFISSANGTNAAYYEALALSVEGIAKAKAYGKIRGVGTVDVYVGGNGVKCDDSAVDAAQELISENRELNVDVKVIAASPYKNNLSVEVVGEDAYTEDEIVQKCTEAYAECLSKIDIGGTLYLSSVANYIMNTGCIKNYTFDIDMENHMLSGSQFFDVGTVNIKVIYE